MTTRATLTTLPRTALRSTEDFHAMWREIAQTDANAWTIAHAPFSDLFSMWEPRLDLLEQDDAYVLRAELPGMQQDDLTITCHDGVLTVHGEQTIESTTHAAAPRTKYGSRAFVRRFVLAEPVDADAMTMTCAHGKLAVYLPKALAAVEQESVLSMAS